MKIIKVGKVISETKQKTCSKCNSELEYVPKDIKTDREGKYIICPVCGQFLAV